MIEVGEGLPVFGVGYIVGVQLDRCVQGLGGFLNIAKCELRLEQTFVDSGELWVDSDASLAVFNCLFELLH